MIFAIHISSLYNYNLLTSFGSKILYVNFLIMLIVNVAVPLFMILSAVLFYRNYKLEDTKQKYKARFRTLVVPYLFWNLFWTIFQYICSYTYISHFFIGREKAIFSFGDLFKGIFLYKYTPFWFIFDLILFVALCPIIYILLKNKVIGAIVIVLASIICEKSVFLDRILFRRDCFVYYLIGAYVGIHFFYWFIKRKNKLFALFSFCLCVGIIYFYSRGGNMLSYSFGNIVVITIYCFGFWFMFDLFQNKRYFSFEKESFLIYAMHINVSAVIAKLLYLVLPQQDFIAPINYIFTIICTISCISVFACIVDNFVPKLRLLITGSR